MTAFPRCPECNGQRVPMNYVGDVVGAVCYCGFARRAEPSTSFEDVYRTQTAEITRLRAEVDLVIAQREAWRVSALTCQRSSAEFAANADRLRAEVEALKAENARLRTANERMRAALERVRCRDWAPDWVRDIANRALEGGE